MFDNSNDRHSARGFARFAPRGPQGHGFPHGGGFGPGFGPFGPGFGGPRGRSRARRGDVRLVLLSLLGDAESNGYGLISTIAERTEGRWRPSPGSVYPTLQQLVDEGLVEGVGSGRGEVYRLTEDGQSYLKDNAEAIDAAWGGLPGQGGESDGYWEAFGKLAMASRQFHGQATEEQRRRITERFDALRREIYGTLAE